MSNIDILKNYDILFKNDYIINIFEDETNESFCKYVSSRGLIKSMDIYSPKPFSNTNNINNINNINNNIKITETNSNYIYPDFVIKSISPTIYIRNSAIPFFIKNILPSIKFKFILISGDDDELIPDEIFNTDFERDLFILDDRLIHWFCQNWRMGNNRKVTLMPIGLDYHTLSNINHTTNWGSYGTPINQERELLDIINDSNINTLPFWKRKPICYGNFHFNLHNHKITDRMDAIKQIPPQCIYYEPVFINRIKIWQNQSKYCFVASPRGNGLDCHRTWEALVLGCIPVVTKSPLDILYNDLPVLIVEKWSDITPELLNETIIKMKIKYEKGEFKFEQLTLKYWVDKINSYKIPIKFI